MSDSENELALTASDLDGTDFAATEKILAFRSEQGSVQHYTYVAPMRALLHTVRRPDPDTPLAGNRKVDPSRARRFGEYLYENAIDGVWICPSLLLRAEPRDLVAVHPLRGNVVQIEVLKHRQWGIHDGQHRDLGLHSFVESMDAKITKLRRTFDAAERDGDRQAARYARRELELEQVKMQRILDESQVQVTLVVATPQEHEQMFADIAQNAKGINPDFAKWLDKRDPVNLIALALMEDLPVLQRLVSTGQDGRVSARSPELIGLKSLTDIVHAVIVGPGRVGKRVRETLLRDERLWRDRCKEFLLAVFENLSSLNMLVNSEVDAHEVRESSLAGSATMLRVLAIGWHLALHDDDLADGERMTVGEMHDFLQALDPHMECFSDVEVERADGSTRTVRGVPADHPLWMPTRKFQPGTKAPSGRQGDVNEFGKSIATWMRHGNELLAWDPSSNG